MSEVRLQRIVLFALGLVSLLAIVPCWKFISIVGGQFDGNKASQLGSYWSGLAALFFSGLALYLLYLTYRKQSEELAETRALVVAQNETLKEAQESTQAQLETLRLQRFEQTYLAIIDLLYRSIDRLDPSVLAPWFASPPGKYEDAYLSTDQSVRDFYDAYPAFNESELQRITYIIDQAVTYLIKHDRMDETLYKGLLEAAWTWDVERAFVFMVGYHATSKSHAQKAKDLRTAGLIRSEPLRQLPVDVRIALEKGQPYTVPYER